MQDQCPPSGSVPTVCVESMGAEGLESRQPTIAVVDDDTAILRALERLIRSRGASPRVFSSPSEFIRSTGTTTPDCLILDVQIPSMSGLELHDWLRERGFKFPIIFITAHEDPKAEAYASRAGAAGFLYKPFHNEVLWSTVREALAAPPALSDRRGKPRAS